MTQTYAQLQKQISQLQREAEVLKRKEVDGVIARRYSNRGSLLEAIKTNGLGIAPKPLILLVGPE